MVGNLVECRNGPRLEPRAVAAAHELELDFPPIHRPPFPIPIGASYMQGDICSQRLRACTEDQDGYDSNPQVAAFGHI